MNTVQYINEFGLFEHRISRKVFLEVHEIVEALINLVITGLFGRDLEPLERSNNSGFFRLESPILKQFLCILFHHQCHNR